jgi:hypothetical protein
MSTTILIPLTPFFYDCVGAIDDTHVLARVPRHMQQAFRGRKHNPTQNVMTAVDFDLLILLREMMGSLCLKVTH